MPEEDDEPQIQPGLPGSTPPDEVEQLLLDYMQDCYTLDGELVRQFLQSASGPIRWTGVSEDGIPVLHLAAIVEVSTPEDMRMVISDLLGAGADPMLKDEDDDTPLDGVLALLGDAEEPSEEDGDEEPHDKKLTHMAAVSALLACPRMIIDRPVIVSVLSWLRNYMRKTDGVDEVMKTLRARAKNGEKEVDSILASERLLEYVEECAYNNKCDIDPKKVAKFIARGATPMHSQNEATCLLMVVLNPYCSYAALQKVFRLMVDVDIDSCPSQSCARVIGQNASTLNSASSRHH